MDNLLQLSKLDQAALDDYLTHLEQIVGEQLVGVMLFGSKARNEADSESDLDIVVLVEENNAQLQSALWIAAADIGLIYDQVISVRVYDLSRWYKMADLDLPFYQNIITDGIVLAGHLPLTPNS